MSKKSILITSNDKPKEKTDQTVDNSGKIVTNHYMSGKHGSWNDANAYFTLTRKKTGKNYVYSAQLPPVNVLLGVNHIFATVNSFTVLLELSFTCFFIYFADT